MMYCAMSDPGGHAASHDGDGDREDGSAASHSGEGERLRDSTRVRARMHLVLDLAAAALARGGTRHVLPNVQVALVADEPRKRHEPRTSTPRADNGCDCRHFKICVCETNARYPSDRFTPAYPSKFKPFANRPGFPLFE